MFSAQALDRPYSFGYILDRSVLNGAGMAQAMQKRPVGRPREFDEEKALEAAMDAFWRRGYEATSLADLCDCTGLHKGSLYQAFGGKHELFMRALRHYADSEFQRTSEVISETKSPLQNIRAVADKILTDGSECQGCMMVNSMVELAPHDPLVKAEIERAGDQRLSAMTEMLKMAQQQGEIRSELEPARLARQLMVTFAGVAATIKGYLDAEAARETVEDVIDSWT